MSGIRIGIVGLGFMGRRYARYVSLIEGMTLAGVVDVNATLANAVASETGALVYGDAAALAAKVDGLIVCTPEHLHVEPALAGIAAGKPVMIEKPIAESLAAAETIREAAATAGTPVLVAHLLRFEARWVAARHRIDSGAIGDVLSITTRRIGNILDQDVLRGRTSIPLYYGVHDLDVMGWYAGGKATSITAHRRSGALNAAGYAIDDLYNALVSFDNGVEGTAELGWHVPANAVAAKTAGVAIVGSKGAIRIEQGETGFECWTEAGLDRALDTCFWLEAYGIPAGALGLEIRHFGDIVRSRREPVIAIGEAIDALRLSLAMEHAANTGQSVDLTTFGARATG